MKKLSKQQQKEIMGGGPCGKKTCTFNPLPGAVFIGACPSTMGCYAPYYQVIAGDCSSITFCSTGI